MSGLKCFSCYGFIYLERRLKLNEQLIEYGLIACGYDVRATYTFSLRLCSLMPPLLYLYLWKMNLKLQVITR